MKTNKPTIQYYAGFKTVTIPAGLKVVPASNLPEDSEIKYWLEELTPELEADAEIESHFRNYGFGLSAAEVTE